VEGGDETILIAEDNDAVRDLIREVLVEYGYTVVEALDGMDAIEKYKGEDGIDLLILDSVMPKKNGYDVYKELIRINPDIKVLFTSGHTRDVFLEKGIEDEKFEFLPKPILPDVLLQRVRKVLDTR
jgi:CheY-like chemotaxis protein